jgi:hypothetical protein
MPAVLRAFGLQTIWDITLIVMSGKLFYYSQSNLYQCCKLDNLVLNKWYSYLFTDQHSIHRVGVNTIRYMDPDYWHIRQCRKTYFEEGCRCPCFSAWDLTYVNC